MTFSIKIQLSKMALWTVFLRILDRIWSFLENIQNLNVKNLFLQIEFSRNHHCMCWAFGHFCASHQLKIWKMVFWAETEKKSAMTKISKIRNNILLKFHTHTNIDTDSPPLTPYEVIIYTATCEFNKDTINKHIWYNL